MNEQEALATLTAMGRQLVRDYDTARAEYHRMTDVPIECVKAAARVCMLVEVIDALGLMNGQEFDRSIPRGGARGQGHQAGAHRLGLRRTGAIQPELTEDEEGYK
jgi:hypothetical protein